MEEIWKDIPGYEGWYQASNMGRIRSVDRLVRGVCHHTGKAFYRKAKGKILRPVRYCKCGHVSVVLGHGAAGSPVHRLIMKTFAGEAPEGMEVLHKNGDPTDNRLENLRYGTRTENILDVYRQGKNGGSCSLTMCRPYGLDFIAGSAEWSWPECSMYLRASYVPFGRGGFLHG